jgi:HNH endonuclease
MIAQFFENDMDEYDRAVFKSGNLNRKPRQSLYVELPLREYGFEDSLFKDFVVDKTHVHYSDVEAYRDDLILTGTLEELYDKIAKEVFYLMFNNREALLKFNYIVAEHMTVDIREIEDIKIQKLFNKNGYLKRVRIPEWCTKAVFFRDRGKCCLCTRNLSGTLSINTGKQYDHIVPLAKGGLNDVSNIQLLCSVCNNKKNKHEIITSGSYESWY